MALQRNKKWILIIIGLAVVGAGTYLYMNKNTKQQASAPQEKITEIKKGTIRSTVSGTSQFEARDIQNVIAPADGTIKRMNLTRNQAVKKGDVLLEISDLTQEITLQEAQVNLQQLENDLNDLLTQQSNMKIYTPRSGILTLGSNLETGSSVNKTSRIATISDQTILSAKLPFLLDDATQFSIGDSIDLTVDGFNLTKTATVDSISNQIKSDPSGGKLLEVEIKVKNDGTLTSGMKVKGKAKLGSRTVESTDRGTLDYVDVETVLANTSGTIKELKLKNGNYITKGDLIVTVVNDTLQKDINTKQAAVDRQKNTINSLQEKFNKLTITAPFDGVFSTDFANKKSNVLASYPVGSTVEVNTLFGAVASLDYMQLPIQVDELDLPNVKTGLKATVKVDSLPNKIFEGEVIQVSTVGTTTNGVTFFDVVISVKNTSELRYGMTATSEIIFQDKKDIITLPIEALQQQQGKRYVTLQNPDGTREDKHEVKIGIRNKTDIEITDGLKAGDKVVIPLRQQKTQNASQADIDRIRQQFQQSGAAGGQAGPGGGAGNPPGAGGGGTQRSGGGGR
ncbi:efflux RND transporter periplasmic adaptor subunit [Paenibacillus radicis (ex Xue et al. 2023)]|uniref:Efflux RND transporter periplasmic adaptor subunit n=1 Tax=Paenibacillus radicis (ex Xue et al. 2023) TaxID=2972489 RepID=A0ABT1YJD2_9BACL|nr:efflux RND transporter periplasmic adaptor subunit [Paenibacillus radicis (ex Xue et al. 2023)]MCR8633264.1 efflux RND transporter periplasmic adaptor subunit [Paenibacillus radicis (ex Xue et al. 2023)]